MKYHITHHINGQSFADDARTASIYDPAIGQQTGTVALATKTTLDKAVAAAKAAFTLWSATPVSRRTRILFQYKMLLEQHMDELAQLVTAEHGKTLADARGSIQRGIDVVEFACGMPFLIKGSYAEDVATDVDSYSIRQALGVCAGITPFNFPAMIPLWMFPIAIACGNTFILKPSEKDPSCAIKLAELIYEAGLPPGVLNVVQGDKEVVDAIIKHPDIRAISFVGSTAVAEKIYHAGIAQGKRVQAFGGAKNHCVIMPDANLDQAVEALVGAAFGSAGERCMAISVAVAVSDELADQLVQRLKPRIQALKIGLGMDETTEMGPLISAEHHDKVTAYINEGITAGAELIVDGRAYSINQPASPGFFMGGSLFDHVTPQMKIYQEEIFGPVLVVIRVANLAEAIALINQHEYGNGTAIFTHDGYSARTFAAKVQVGMIGINIPIPVPVPYQSFGGWKRSIFSDLNMQGTEGIQFYTNVKTITQRWPKEHNIAAEFVIPTMK